MIFDDILNGAELSISKEGDVFRFKIASHYTTNFVELSIHDIKKLTQFLKEYDKT